VGDYDLLGLFELKKNRQIKDTLQNRQQECVFVNSALKYSAILSISAILPIWANKLISDLFGDCFQLAAAFLTLFELKKKNVHRQIKDTSNKLISRIAKFNTYKSLCLH